MKLKISLILLILTTINSFGQTENGKHWTKNELMQHATLKKLANYVNSKEKKEISKDTLFKKYIYFDYVLQDKNLERKENRLSQFDTIFYGFRNAINTIGLENLDAKPMRFYKNHEIYKPFKREGAMESVGGEKMYTEDDNVFAYFKKSEPENPLGELLFEPETNKLVAWIMIDQGGYKYFLTFNLFGN